MWMMTTRRSVTRELDNITSIWTRVSEDFVPFNIDVTTVQPAVLAEGVPIGDANGVAMRVSIGGDGDWFGGRRRHRLHRHVYQFDCERRLCFQ